MEAIQSVGYYLSENGNVLMNESMLTDIKNDAATVGYTSFVGYYYVRLSVK